MKKLLIAGVLTLASTFAFATEADTKTTEKHAFCAGYMAKLSELYVEHGDQKAADDAEFLGTLHAAQLGEGGVVENKDHIVQGSQSVMPSLEAGIAELVVRACVDELNKIYK